jgi:hypothetical protein
MPWAIEIRPVGAETFDPRSPISSTANKAIRLGWFHLMPEQRRDAQVLVRIDEINRPGEPLPVGQHIQGLAVFGGGHEKFLAQSRPTVAPAMMPEPVGISSLMLSFLRGFCDLLSRINALDPTRRHGRCRGDG